MSEASTQSLTRRQREFLRLWEKNPSPSAVAKEMGIDERNVLGLRNRVEAVLGVSLPSGVSKRDGETKPGQISEDRTQGAGLQEKLASELAAARRQLAEANAARLTDRLVEARLLRLTESMSAVKPPEWLIRAPSKRGASVTGVPTLLASDWHWGEVVNASEINGVNAYNLKIAHRRARQMVERSVSLLKTHLAGANYPGIVLCLGGDMMSGDIHDELSQTNEKPVMECLLDLFGVMRTVIKTLADEFGQVFVPCVTGNHGRNTKKPRAKQRNFTNFDWLLYKMLATAFEGDKRVRLLIPDGSDAHWNVYAMRYCMTHGDQFRGGDGMIGALGPITRGDHKKRSFKNQIDLGYDVLLMGHWHQYLHTQRYIVNGSLKGYDEYAASNNFGFERPQQALWVTHPHEGVTFSMPVHVDETPKAATPRQWLTFTE